MARVGRRAWGAWLVAAAVLAGCGGGETASQQETAAGGEPADQQESALLAACGDRVVIQTDWYPQPEHGAVYQLAGPGGEFDADGGIYTNEIGDTGVTAEIRAGGPFIGFQGDVSTLYQDTDILLGFVSSDEAVLQSGRLPVVHVVTPLEKSPQMLMWDPETYDFTEFADIGRSDAAVLHFEGSTYVDHLVAQGMVRREQLDGSYDGSPARFVTEGNVVQQGFATSEPYLYENEFEEWGKPVDYLLIFDSGFEMYPQALSVREEDLEARADCLELLVPMVQQAQVDYMADPGPVNQTLIDIVGQLDDWVLTDGLVEYSVATQLELGIVGNGSDDTLGNFDLERMQRVIDLLAPIYTEQGTESFDPEVTAEDLVTNQFIDPEIGL